MKGNNKKLDYVNIITSVLIIGFIVLVIVAIINP
jgi:hypothetical protein